MALANPIDELDLAAVHDVVVVGSGYGGGVVAARLAGPGRSIVVLERGREHRGSFPARGPALADEVQLDAADLPRGQPLGLYHFHLGAEVAVLVGCGVGGTSLINAGVCSEPEARVFTDGRWPRAIAAEVQSGAFARYFERARAMLEPRPFPESGPQPRKLLALEAAAAAVPGARFRRAEVAVRFGAPGPNAAGVAMESCTRCGDCVTGCNARAKNTVAFTYLPVARQRGARLFAQCEVQRVGLRDGVYQVMVQRLHGDGEPAGPLFTVQARQVVLAAGVLGTVGILLRSRGDLALPVSVGTRFSTNGDALGFAYNGEAVVDGVGHGERADRFASRPAGAAILGLLDARADDGPLDRNLVIEEGAFPSGLAPVLRPLLEVMAAYGGTATRRGLRRWLRERLTEARDLLGLPGGALDRTLLFLLMGHDGADGRLILDGGGRVTVAWPALRGRALFGRQDQAVLQLARHLGATAVRDPLYTPLLGRRLVTVHPLGGAVMADDASLGVVDADGRVFDGKGGVHAGLFIADGAVIPTSLGINPLLTIAAVAERIAEKLQPPPGGPSSRRPDDGAPGP